MLCADVLADFSVFLADIVPKYERVLIVGNCNIHVCCPEIIDSFDRVQCALGPTHERGHTLDLVLSCGLPVFNSEVWEAFFSDHMPVFWYCFRLLCAVAQLTLPLLLASQLRSVRTVSLPILCAMIQRLCLQEAAPPPQRKILGKWSRLFVLRLCRKTFVCAVMVLQKLHTLISG